MMRDDLAELVAAASDDDERETDDLAEVVLTAPMILFRAGDRWYGVLAENVREVVAKDHVARVPAMPSHVLGVALVHSRLVPVVDLAVMLGRTGPSPTSHRRLVVIEGNGGEVSVLADEARGVIEVPLAGETTDDRFGFVAGEITWGEELVCVLDAPSLVDTMAEAIA